MKWLPEEAEWIVATLQSIDLFSLDLTQLENYKADIRMLVESMSRERFETGQTVIVEGQEGVSLYLIRSGRAGVWVTRNGERLKLASLGPGSCFGEISLLTGEPCTATVIVEGEGEPLEAYTLKPKVFRGIVKGNPQFASHVTRLVADRLAERNKGLKFLEKDTGPTDPAP